MFYLLYVPLSQEMITFEPSNSKLHAEAALFVKQWREGKDYGML